MTQSRPTRSIAGVPLRQFLLAAAAMALGAGLCGLLVYRSGHSVDYWLVLLRAIDLRWAALALAGMVVNLVLAAQKWRHVEARLAGSPPSSAYAVSITAVGWGVGQFLPVPVAAAVVRGVGNRVSRRSGRHGMLASAWEQLFDLGAAVLLTGPALVALVQGRVVNVCALTVVALWCGELGAVWVPRLLGRFGRIASALSAPGLCRYLWRLSLLRTIVLMLVTMAIARAMAADIQPGLIAAAVPPVILAGVLSFVPAGIGVNELSFVALLGLAGVPAATATAFALINRVLQLIIALLLALLGLVMFAPRSAMRTDGV